MQILVRPLLAIASVVAVTVALTSSAYGQQSSPRDRALALVKAGAEKFESGDKHAAIGDFERAYRIYPAPEILFNLGKAYTRINEAARAYKAFQQFLHDGKMVAADRRNEATQALQNLEPYIGRLKILAPQAKGATITVDGTVLGTAPLAAPVIVKPGAHLVRAVINNKQWATAQVGVSGGKSETVVLLPTPAHAVKPAQPAVTYTPLPPGPIYARWWFWTALVAVASATAIVLTTRGDAGSGQTDLGRFPFDDF